MEYGIRVHLFPARSADGRARKPSRSRRGNKLNEMAADLVQSAEIARSSKGNKYHEHPVATRRVRVLAFMEAYSVTGPAKNLIEFAARAAAYPPNEGAEICFVTFVRGVETAENGFVREIRNRGLEARVVAEK